MKITALLIPLIFSSILSSPINDKNKPTVAVDAQEKLVGILKTPSTGNKKPRMCLIKEIVVDKLNSTRFKEELDLIWEEELDVRNITISHEENMRCAVNVTKNSETGDFNFAYKMIPTVDCLNQNDIICDMQSNCTSAIKCCDLSEPICLNIITIKPVYLDNNSSKSRCTSANETSCYMLETRKSRVVLPTKKSATTISKAKPSSKIRCTGTNKTSCYELEPTKNITFVAPTKKNSATAISKANPINYITAILMYLAIGLNLNK